MTNKRAALGILLAPLIVLAGLFVPGWVAPEAAYAMCDRESINSQIDDRRSAINDAEPGDARAAVETEVADLENQLAACDNPDLDATADGDNSDGDNPDETYVVVCRNGDAVEVLEDDVREGEKKFGLGYDDCTPEPETVTVCDNGVEYTVPKDEADEAEILKPGEVCVEEETPPAPPANETEAADQHQRDVVLYTCEPGAVGSYAFGPDLGEDANLAVDEIRSRIHHDPALLVQKAVEFDIVELNWDEQFQLAERLRGGDFEYWAELEEDINVYLDESKLEIVTMPAGTYRSMQMVPTGDCGTPRLAYVEVERSAPFKVLRIHHVPSGNVTDDRLVCGGQPQELVTRESKEQPKERRDAPTLPEPVPGIDRNEEGHPEREPEPVVTPTTSSSPTVSPTPTTTPAPQEPERVKVKVCRDGDVIEIFEDERRSTDQPPNAEQCKVTEATPTPTPTPTTPPPGGGGGSPAPVVDACPDDKYPHEPGPQPAGTPCKVQTAPQPDGVERPEPENNPVGTPTAEPPAQQDPLTPDTDPETTQPSGGDSPQAPGADPVDRDVREEAPTNEGQPETDPVPAGDFCQQNPDSPVCG